MENLLMMAVVLFLKNKAKSLAFKADGWRVADKEEQRKFTRVRCAVDPRIIVLSFSSGDSSGE